MRPKSSLATLADLRSADPYQIIAGQKKLIAAQKVRISQLETRCEHLTNLLAPETVHGMFVAGRA